MVPGQRLIELARAFRLLEVDDHEIALRPHDDEGRRVPFDEELADADPIEPEMSTQVTAHRGPVGSEQHMWKRWFQRDTDNLTHGNICAVPPAAHGEHLGRSGD